MGKGKTALVILGTAIGLIQAALAAQGVEVNFILAGFLWFLVGVAMWELLGLLDSSKWRSIGRLVGGLAIVVVWLALGFWGPSANPSPSDTSIDNGAVPPAKESVEVKPDAKQKPTALYATCQMSLLPLHIQRGAVMHIQMIRSKPQGFSTVHNGSEKVLSWPSEDVLHGAWVCAITNHGDTALLEPALTFKLDFKEAGKIAVAESRNYNVRLGPLQSRGSFPFAMVNCTQFAVSINYPEAATAQVFGESARRQIPVLPAMRSLLTSLPLEPVSKELSTVCPAE